MASAGIVGFPGRLLKGAWNNLTNVFRHAPEDFESLNGVRAICCIWIVWFHNLFLISTYQTKAQYYPITEHWSMWIIRFGFSCVDIFFVLTGFLLCYPYVLKEFTLNKRKAEAHKRALLSAAGVASDAAGAEEVTRVTEFQFNKKVAAAAPEAEYDTSVFQSVKATDYWYKRFVVRIYPPLIVALLLHCVIIFPNGQMNPYSMLPSTATFEYLKEKYIPDLKLTDKMTASCFLTPANLLFANNQLPFGGCMGWTWSLAIQGQFYFLLPFILKYTRRARNLLVFCGVAFIANLYFRLTAINNYFHVLQEAPPMAIERKSEMERFEVWFAGFYMPTSNRFGAIVIGMVVAYVQARLTANDESDSICVRAVNWYKRQSVVLHAVVFAVAFYFVTRHKDWENSKFYLIFEFIGGPLFNLAFAYIMFIALNSISVIGAAINAFLSWRVWVGISRISYSVYLLHCSVIMKSFGTIFYPAPSDILFLWKAIAFNTTVVIVLCTVLYAFIEKPVTDYLASRIATATAPKRKD